MSAAELEARILHLRLKCRERDRDAYAQAVTDWQDTRALPKATHGWERGAKMSATYQLKKAGRALDRLLLED